MMAIETPGPRRVLRVTLSGMRTVHCARAVFTALTAVEGIHGAEVAVGSATLEHDGRATVDQVRAAVEPLGYAVVDWADERAGLRVVDDDGKRTV
ncbi:MAG TPA: cation transporter [Gemmatimonadaceae bacterium]|nr:cation transporter [Gemmatimonadaceae bacterium]